MRTVATLLLACTLSGAAPAPAPKTRPAPAPAAPGPAAGDWSMTWSGTPCAVRLGALYEAPLDAGLKGRTREGFSVELRPAGGAKR